MKLIIDIDKQHFELLQMAVRNGMGDNAQKIIAQGIPISDNATNGDVIKVLYPNADIEIHNITVYVIFDTHSNVISFDLDWWNAPYKAESEVRNE